MVWTINSRQDDISEHPRWIDRHSINCCNCGALVDERDCMPVKEGELCKECQISWKEEISNHLANLPTTEIIEGIIKPAIEQVITDLEDSLLYYDKTTELVQINITQDQIDTFTEMKQMLTT